jgi:hypothetical protein
VVLKWGLFHFVLADRPPNNNRQKYMSWPSVDDTDIFLSVDSGLIYDIEKILNCTGSFDEYDITDYYEDSAKQLLWHIDKSIEENNEISDLLFRKKYDYTLDSLESDSGEYLVKYDKSRDFERAKLEIQTVLTIIKNALEVAIRENKSMSILGV